MSVHAQAARRAIDAFRGEGRQNRLMAKSTHGMKSDAVSFGVVEESDVANLF